MRQVQIEWHYGEKPEPEQGYYLAAYNYDHPEYGRGQDVTLAWFKGGIWTDWYGDLTLDVYAWARILPPPERERGKP